MPRLDFSPQGTSDHRVGECDQQGMQQSPVGANLWLEQGREQEWMLGKFDNLDGSVVPIATDDKTGLPELGDQCRRQAIAAVVIAEHGLRTADGAGLGAGHRAHQPALADEGAGKWNDDRHALSVHLGVSRIVDPDDIPGVLDEHVLESASGAEERHTLLAGVPDGGEGTLSAAVRAPRRNPDTVEAGEISGRIADLVGRRPRCRDAVGQAVGGTVQSGMRRESRVVVADDCYARSHHSVRIAEELRSPSLDPLSAGPLRRAGYPAGAAGLGVSPGTR
jgi:hypothetical protein